MRAGDTVADPQSRRYLDIAAEIADLAEKDQEMRCAAMADPSRWDAEADRRHTARMKEILAEIGWPTTSKVGRLAAHRAWLLVQHADHDVDFQRECLRLMSEAPEGEVSRVDMAYLEDRVRVNDGRPQLYGTQFHLVERGELVPRPIEDPERLDQRRQAVGLESFAQYQQRIRTRP